MRNKSRSHRLSAMLLPVSLIPALASADFLTPTPAMIGLEPDAPVGSEVMAIISSGDVIPGGFLFEGLPDGIGVAPAAVASSVDVFVTHEQTTVPFFGQRDFQDASISRVTLNTTTGAVMSASVALPPTEGFLRFCSAFMAGPAEGFSTYTLFTGEEANDIVDIPAGATSYGSDPALAPNRQAGYAVALDTSNGAFTTVPGLGRLNHENTIAVPGGWKQHALLTTDDTFSAPSAQLYLYLANRESHIWMDKGSLWAFQVTRTQDGAVDQTDPFNGANDYLDINSGDDWKGKFIRVPKEIARGQTAEPPQNALENWSNENNVFQFIRLEDLTYDRNNPRVVYIADTGTSRIVPDESTGRMLRGPSGTTGMADNGRIFRMEFNKKNPRKVDSFSILADGDDTGSPVYVPFRNPDNMDASTNSLMVQEDEDDAKIWRRDAVTSMWSVIAKVLDPDGESSGIVDASQWFGAGSWLLNVQGHGSNVDEEIIGGVTLKRESGQLLLLKVPGS